MGLHPLIQNRQIFTDNGAVPLQQLVTVLQCQGSDGVVNHAAADQVIIPVGAESPKRILVVGGNPSHADAGQGEYLGHAADGDAFFVQVNNGGKVAVFLGQVPVDLIAQHISVNAAGNGNNLLQQFLGHECAGGIVGVVDADQFCAWGSQAAQFVQIRQIMLLLLQVHNGHVCPDGFGNGIQLLIGGHNADHPISGGNQGAEHVMIGTGCTVGRYNLLRRQGAV